MPTTVVSYRPAPEDALKLEQLRGTFPKQQWKEVFDWIFDNDDLVEAIKARIAES